MTIAIGFRCVGGVVLAADSQYTEGIAKLDGKKIFPIPSNSHYALTLAGSGGASSLAGIVKEIEQGVERDIGLRATEFGEITGVIESSLRAYYPQYIDSAPESKRDDLEAQFLIAVWVAGSGTQLYQTYRTKAFDVDRHRCIGVGAYLAECLTDLFVSPQGVRPSVQLAQALAAHIVGEAKKYVEFCGGQTFVRALMDDGTDERISQEEVRDAESYFRGFFEDLSHVRKMLAVTADSDMGSFVEILRKRLVQFQNKQQEYQEARAAIRRAARS